MMQIYVLGALSIMVDGRRLKAPKKAQALLAYLALQAGMIVTRQRLAELLWPCQDSEAARHSLRNCLLELRKALGPDAAATLESDFHVVRLVNPSTDVERFTNLASSHLLADLEIAGRLYRGELLEDLEIASESWDEWLAGERRRLHDIAALVLYRLSRVAGAAGRHGDAIGAARRLLGLEPYSEAAHRRMMQALVAADRRGDAILYFRQCEAFLRRELGVGPGVKTRNLLREIQASEILADPPGADYAAVAAATAVAEIASLRATLAAEIARNAEMTRALEKLHDILRELTAPPMGAGGNGRAPALMELAA